MERIEARYVVAADEATIEARARAIAVEQSVEMPVTAIRDQHVLDEVVGRVAGIVALGPGRYEVHISLAASTVGTDPAQLVNMVFGNVSLQEDVELLDVALPPSVLAGFPGPVSGVPGLRELVGAGHRALTCAVLKPQGLSAADLADLCHRFALAGVDIVKDDHGLADQAAAPFAERVKACQAAVEKAEARTGRRALYAPSLVGTPRQLARQAGTARAVGIEVVLVAPLLVGLPAFAELVREDLGGMAVLGHPSFGGNARIAPPFLFGRLLRLYGADVVIFPNHGGRFSYSRERCADLATAARAPWSHVRPAMPAPAGGMTLDRVDELLDDYGADTMLVLGGALLAEGDHLVDATRRVTERVAAHAASALTPGGIRGG
jgi:ribulose-bisphosphate carboxylase large chain